MSNEANLVYVLSFKLTVNVLHTQCQCPDGVVNIRLRSYSLQSLDWTGALDCWTFKITFVLSNSPVGLAMHPALHVTLVLTHHTVREESSCLATTDDWTSARI